MNLKPSVIIILMGLALILGCDGSGDDDTERIPGKADILWIVDSSNSMQQDQENLQASFSDFINELEETINSELGNPDLYQMGVTTTQSLPCEYDPNAWTNCMDSVGNMGRLRSLANAGQDTSHPPNFLRPDSETLIEDFQTLVSVGVDGSTAEYGLWVTAEAVCASLAMPDDSDFDWDSGETIYECDGDNWNDNHPWADFCRCLPQDLYDYNINEERQRFLRDGATLVVVIVSDEGDYPPVPVPSTLLKSLLFS